jgi:hypothetical protein
MQALPELLSKEDQLVQQRQRLAACTVEHVLGAAGAIAPISSRSSSGSSSGRTADTHCTSMYMRQADKGSTRMSQEDQLVQQGQGLADRTIDMSCELQCNSTEVAAAGGVHVQKGDVPGRSADTAAAGTCCLHC